MNTHTHIVMYIIYACTCGTVVIPYLPISLQSMTMEISSSTTEREKKLSSDPDLEVVK